MSHTWTVSTSHYWGSKRLMKCARRKNKESKKSNKALKVYYNRRVLAYYSHKKTSARELLKNNSAYWQTLLNAFSFHEKTTQTIHLFSILIAAVHLFILQSVNRCCYFTVSKKWGQIQIIFIGSIKFVWSRGASRHMSSGRRHMIIMQ